MKRLLRVLACALLTLALLPATAWAKSYEVGPVEIDATLGADGSLLVVEQRTYTFVGSYNGIYWDVPRGQYQGRTIEPVVTWVGAITPNGQKLFEEGAGGTAGTYEVSEQPDCLRLKMLWPATDEAVTFQMSYELPSLATRWADVGELYWQYVPADPGSEGEWTSVRAAVHLPVPDGEAVIAGQNVRAWAHGPLDGEVSIDGDKVTFFSPGVGAAERLEARVTFPEGWLGNAPQVDEAHLDSVLAEEGRWAKDANARRWQARLVVYGVPAFMSLWGVGAAACMQWHEAKRKRQIPQAQFGDTYFRDVPTDDHPAVLGMLYRGGNPDAKGFAATLMRLVDQGRVAMDIVTTRREDKRGRVKEVREWCLRKRDRTLRRPDRHADNRKIDDRAYDFLFTVVADKHKHVVDPSLLGASDEPYVLMSFFGETAQKWPGAYAAGFNKWSDAVRAQYDARNFETRLPDDGLFIALLGLGTIALSVVVAIAGMLLGTPNIPLCIGFIVCFGGGLYVILKDEGGPSVVLSQEAADIIAKLKALRRWLTDFTRLEEAIPTDVVLWNRLLIMATVLGVADEVIKQLAERLPDVLQDEDFLGNGWQNEIEHPPVGIIDKSVGAAVAVSAAALYHGSSPSTVASSHDSSPSGGGGGFSSGGGGGFSGGGRGGAF